MKTTKLAIATLLIISVATSSCKKGCMDTDAENYSSEVKKDDGSCVYAPTITLNGAATITLSVGDTYTDLGATAQNEDGSSATVTVDESDVNTASVGTYTVTYTASNEHGTAVATRKVVVEINQSTFIADWDCVSDCSTTQFPVDGTRTLIAGTTSSEFIIDGAFTLVGGQISCQISGTTITVPSQTVAVTGGDVTLSGSGTINNTGTEFTVDFTYDNTIPFIGGTGACTATYTKQ
ncbi:MAG: DUF5011 domain-containing protein [Flavobacteriales bacterium]|nr:DUF5011 domain-containing protein [Flavobacteriales bacterium]